MAHVMFGGLTHAPAVELGRLLRRAHADGCEHVFFSDSGSVSVEVAIKMALQYWQARGQAREARACSRCAAATTATPFGAMAVCDPVTGMHHLFARRAARSTCSRRVPSRAFDAAWDASASAEIER